MGGPGSGNTWQYGKDLTTEYRSIDVRRWAREGFLKAPSYFGWEWQRDGEAVAQIKVHITQSGARLIYRTRDTWGDWEPMDYTVRLLSQPMPTGGMRQWFACPARGCGRRVAKLYGGKVFACRHCHDLAYPSQREEPHQRYKRRADKLADRLGWNDADGTAYGTKPKGMHWRTFQRLAREQERFDTASDLAFANYFHGRFAHLLR